MKINSLLFPALLLFAISFAACDDGDSTIGGSLVNDNSEVVIDTAFTLTGSSYREVAVQSRTTTQLLGNVDAKGFGRISSDFVTQFLPSAQLDTVGVSVNDIDSVKMLMFFHAGAFTGDSLVPMGFKVYPLKRQLKSPIYSNFDPADYYDESDCWTPRMQIYTGNALYNDSVSNLGYRTISVKLPVEFGRRFYNEYVNNPETFATPQAFANFFPGLYVKNLFGSGRITNIHETRINFYYKKHAKVIKNEVERDTIYKVSSAYMSVTPEVITDNVIRYTVSDDLNKLVADGQTLLVAPTGYNIRMTFPTREIIESYRSKGGDMSVINSLTLSIPVEEVKNQYSIKPPTYVLMVLESERESFFANNKINDDKTSFLSTYDNINHCYNVTGMRQYIIVSSF